MFGNIFLKTRIVHIILAVTKSLFRVFKKRKHSCFLYQNPCITEGGWYTIKDWNVSIPFTSPLVFKKLFISSWNGFFSFQMTSYL